MITVVHWLKCIIIMQKLTSMVEFWALLSSHWSPLLIDHSCEVMYVVMQYPYTGNNNDVAKHYTVCEWARGWTISVWKIQIWPVIDLCKSPAFFYLTSGNCTPGSRSYSDIEYRQPINTQSVSCCVGITSIAACFWHFCSHQPRLYTASAPQYQLITVLDYS